MNMFNFLESPLLFVIWKLYNELKYLTRPSLTMGQSGPNVEL